MLAGKKILIGITGSIAAYKTIILIRLLVKAKAEVKIVMTSSAQQFVSPLVLSTLSKNEVAIDLASNNLWTNHVKLGRWADIMLMAPLSCNTLAKMANGICDNLLMAVYLSATCPVIIAPAMDEDMWHHPSTKKNIETVKSYGSQIINVEEGELASGLLGDGRMAESANIFTYLVENYFRKNELKNKKVIVTAGPTVEAIDPVRYITNHSSGKMGIALAESLYMHGADVHLICGPVNIKPQYKGIQVINILSAQQMLEATEKYFTEADILVMNAAVADYSPIVVADKKIKKKEDDWTLALKKNIDILSVLGKQKSKQFMVGFALETNNAKENALQKLKNKNADCIILNSLLDEKAGFGYDTNKITILGKDGEEKKFELKSKLAVAEDIVQYIINKNA